MALKPQASGVLSREAHSVLTHALENPFVRLETCATGLRLSIEEGPDAGTAIEIEGSVVSGGRGKGQDIRLSDTQVSDAHFELRMVPKKGLRLRDLGSRNGTWVGRARLHGEVELFEGASFFVGSTRIRVVGIDKKSVPVASENVLGNMYGTSLAMRRLFALLRSAAPTDLEVLLEGETGTGKEEAARALHELSGRAGQLVAVNCAAMPRELAESRLFGHRKGAYTGAVGDAAGAFEAAHGGTLFLDELGELPLDLQPKLLRALDRHEVVRLGEQTPRRFDVRVVTATNRDLGRMVSEGTFREDLFHRIAAVRLVLPPLRERKEDIPGLADALLRAYEGEQGIHRTLSVDAIEALQALDWRGNVRQLRAVLRRTAALSADEQITRASLQSFGSEWGSAGGCAASSAPEDGGDDKMFGLPLKEAVNQFKARYCQVVLDRCGGDFDRAVAASGYSRRGFTELLSRVGEGSD